MPCHRDVPGAEGNFVPRGLLIKSAHWLGDLRVLQVLAFSSIWDMGVLIHCAGDEAPGVVLVVSKRHQAALCPFNIHSLSWPNEALR